MDGVDNEYIGTAITSLLSTIGIKEPVDSQKITSLLSSKKVREAIQEIAQCLGLPIEVTLSYVKKGYRPNDNDGFQSTHLVKTDWRGRGTASITAQVSIPSSLPLYGTPAMQHFPINVRVSENCADNPMTLVGVMAHELSHILLSSLWHKEKENEFYTDLTAMMLGFSDVMSLGRKVVNTSFLSSSTETTTQTTTYGYLSDGNFVFALERIKETLQTRTNAKKHLTTRIKELEGTLEKEKAETLYFKQYLDYLDNHYEQDISKQDGYLISRFHQADYTDEFESALRRTKGEITLCASFLRNLNNFADYRLQELENHEKTIQSLGIDRTSKYAQIKEAVIVLRKYVSIRYRFQTFLKVRTETASQGRHGNH